MASRSFALVASLAALCMVSAQGVPLSQADVAGPTAAPSLDCGPCYIVADVAGVIFGTETSTNTVTMVTSVGVGNNGTNITTSYTVGSAQFSLAPSSLLGGGFTGTLFDPGPTITLSGAVLASPTIYNVFNTYSYIETTPSGGKCVANTQIASLDHGALPIAMLSGVNPNDFYTSAELAFKSSLGIFSCSITNNVQTQTHVQLTESTTVSTTVGPIRLTPQAISTNVPATATAEPTAAASVVVVGNVTFLPTGSANQTLNLFMGSSSTNSRNTVLLTGVGLLSLILGIWTL